MGWERCTDLGFGITTYYRCDRCVSDHHMTQGGKRIDFAPSRDIAHAFEVVAKLEKRNLEITIQRYVEEYWAVVFAIPERPTCWEGTADELPLAICRAALKAAS